MKYESTKLKQMLAAEYVIGTLVGGARKHFKRWLARDRWLRGEVRYWEERFAQLGVFEAVPPRDAVWAEIQFRIETMKDKVVPLDSRRRQRGLNFWRAWSGLATAASLLLAVVLLSQPTREPATSAPTRVLEVKVPAQSYVAALRLPKEDAQWTVSVLPDTRLLRVIVNGPAKLSVDEDYQLWWLADEGVTSLGLLPRSGAWEALLPANVRPSAAGKVAVSLEPAGGSQAEKGPSGPVLLAAPLVPAI
ncbi:MAG: anti-sigma factor [Panacagrimonas sp.]